MWALGMLLSALALATSGAQGTETPPGVIEGVVYDSLLTKRPLQGATVYIIGTTLVATTDSRGRFAIAGVPDGAHTLTFSHPVFDSAGVQAPQVGVDVTGASRARVALAAPRGASLVKAVCPGTQTDQTGLLLGVVRDVENGLPLPEARVVSRWFELTIGKKGPHYDTFETTAAADRNGVFRLCGVPADIPVFVRALAGTQESGRVEVYFAGNDVLFRDFAISTTDTAARAIGDSLSEGSDSGVVSIAGAGVVRGVVRDANGRPLANVRVNLLDRRLVTTANSDGYFTLVGIPAGTQTLELRAIGYAPARQTVVLKSSAPAEVALTLDRAAQKLASISVIGTRKDGRLTKFGFEERRRRGIGFFMDGDEIAKKSGIKAGDVLRFAPGVMPEYTAKGRTFSMRSKWNGNRCSPTYYLDGMRWYPLGRSPILELEQFMSLNDLAAVEVYPGGAGTPMQFDSGTGCGAVVFWTK
jgi:hypothetical protein